MRKGLMFVTGAAIATAAMIGGCASSGGSAQAEAPQRVSFVSSDAGGAAMLEYRSSLNKAGSTRAMTSVDTEE